MAVTAATQSDPQNTFSLLPLFFPRHRNTVHVVVTAVRCSRSGQEKRKGKRGFCILCVALRTYVLSRYWGVASLLTHTESRERDACEAHKVRLRLPPPCMLYAVETASSRHQEKQTANTQQPNLLLPFTSLSSLVLCSLFSLSPSLLVRLLSLSIPLFTLPLPSFVTTTGHSSSRYSRHSRHTVCTCCVLLSTSLACDSILLTHIHTSQSTIPVTVHRIPDSHKKQKDGRPANRGAGESYETCLMRCEERSRVTEAAPAATTASFPASMATSSISTGY